MAKALSLRTRPDLQVEVSPRHDARKSVMGPLDGRHALITGGGTGIGAAIAHTLSEAGAAITVAGRRENPLSNIAAKLPKAATVTADVTREADCAAMVAAA